MDIEKILGKLWDSLDTDIVDVLDEDSVNMENAKIRLVHNGIYLYVDDINGFTLVDSDVGRRLAG